MGVSHACDQCEWSLFLILSAVKYVLSGGNYPFMALAMLKQARMTLIGRFEGGCGQALLQDRSGVNEGKSPFRPAARGAVLANPG